MTVRIYKDRLRVRVLRAAEAQASQHFKMLLGHVTEATEHRVTYAPENPATFLLQKSLARDWLDTRDEKAITDANRRIEHGAPSNAGAQLPPEVTGRLFQQLPFRGGKLDLATPNRFYGPGEEANIREELVPLHNVVSYGPLDLLSLRRVAGGDYSENIEATKDPTSNRVTIRKGHNAVFMGKILGFPALPMALSRPSNIDDSGDPNGTDPALAELFGHELVKDYMYTVPSYWEPYAELARELDEATFQTIAESPWSTEELEARDLCEALDVERSKAWIMSRNAAMNEGATQVQAIEFADKQPIVRRAALRAQEAVDTFGNILQRWLVLRGRFQAAKELSQQYMEEDGIDPQTPTDWQKFWMEANKGTGAGAMYFAPGDQVEVQDNRSRWQPAQVLQSDGFSALVTVNGQQRRINDPTKIKARGDGDLFPGSGYDEGMDDVVLDRFNVKIPAGSNSHRIEAALVNSTKELNSTPLRVNKATWKKNQAAMEEQAEALTKVCREHIGDVSFRPNANADCAKLLFTDLKLPIQRASKTTGAPSVDKETLTALSQMGHEVADKIMKAREAITKLSQLNAWEPYANAGLVQTNWDQFGQPHGRYTSDGPNLQNRIDEIRETIEPPEGWVLLSNDVGQAEYVTWASLSKDPTLSQSFLDGTDFHTDMWNQLLQAQPNLGLPGETQRDKGKTANYALLYLMQPYTLAKTLGVNIPDVMKVYDAYEARAPQAMQYQRDYIDQATQSGIASTHFGRVRYLPDTKGARGGRLHELQKTLWHHHNAGTAAELFKFKQAKVAYALAQAKLKARLGLQMHDEMVHLVPEDELEDTKALTMKVMKDPVKDFLPIHVDQKAGSNWLETQ